MIELNRSGKQYEEIESFADYELTQCIAYEFAIRNRNVIELKQDIDNMLKVLMNEYINARDGKIQNFNNDYDELCKKDENYIDKEEYEYDREGPSYEEYFLDKNTKAIDIQRKLNKLLTQYWIRYFFEKDIIVKSFIINHRDPYEENLFIDNESIQRLREHNLIEKLSSVGNSSDNQRVIVTDEILFGGIKDTHKQVDLNKTIIGQRLESLVIPEKYDKSIKFKVNLALPMEELKAQIQALKANFEYDTKIVQTPSELLGEELQKADDISRMCTETKNGKEICFDGRNGITRTQKLADMFFVYDAAKQGAKELRIRTVLSEYYETIGKTTDMSDKTFRKYRDIAIDYIENERYKELITGIKS